MEEFVLKSREENQAKKFVEVVGKTIKNRRCNIKHLEPVDQVIEIKSDDVEAVKKDLESILA